MDDLLEAYRTLYTPVTLQANYAMYCDGKAIPDCSADEKQLRIDAMETILAETVPDRGPGVKRKRK